MRLVERPHDLEGLFDTASAEAGAAFGDAGLYLEKAIVDAHHVEVQVLGDGKGGALVLGDRECSVQRRHQKLMEEGPSPFLTPDTRSRMHEAALEAVRSTRYLNAGTIEFLVGHDQDFYFMEMNTRLQVEHPVTEEITGVDLVREQLRIASGSPLRAAGRAPDGRARVRVPAERREPRPRVPALAGPR